MEASRVSELLGQQLSFYGDRSKVIASNIANIDTPGYKAKDLVKFEDIINTTASSQNKLQMTATHDSHMQASSQKNMQSFSKIAIQNLKEDKTGNNVDIDKQMAEHTKNNIVFKATQAILKKNGSLMKTVIESSVKMN